MTDDNEFKIDWGAFTSGIGLGLDFLGKMDTAKGFEAYGQAAADAAANNAAQLRINAGQAKAKSQYEALEIGRQGDLVLSRAKALSAASGGDSSDPTMVNVMARIQGVIDNNRKMKLYEGASAEQALNYKAKMADYEGQLQNWQAKQTASASRTNAWGGLVKGALGMFDKYSHGSPAKKNDSGFDYNMDSPIG